MARPVGIAVGGMIALAAGMGLGRFLYTPILPVMAGAEGLSAAATGALASANFAGYLAGALLASLPVFAAAPRLWLTVGLVLSAVTTAAMAIEADLWLWSLLRGVAGIASAFILVFASTLVTQALRAAGRPGLSSIHFAGVGAGILISAVITSPLVARAGDWQGMWIGGAVLTVLALVLVLVLVPAPGGAAAASAQTGTGRAGLWRLILAYGCLGFGYIITATFLVAILQDSGAGPAERAWLWAVVGAAAIPSIALWSHLAARWGTIRAYQAAMAIEAVGVAASTLGGTAAMLIAALLLGGTFMGLTALGFQEATRRVGGDGRAVMALMTASFGTGQMLGPSVAGQLREATGSFSLPSLIAAAVLIFGALIVERLNRD